MVMIHNVVVQVKRNSTGMLPLIVFLQDNERKGGIPDQCYFEDRERVRLVI